MTFRLSLDGLIFLSVNANEQVALPHSWWTHYTLGEPVCQELFSSLSNFFLDVRHTLDLMRDSKGRTARSYFPTVHELIIAQPDQLVKKKFLSFSFFFWHGFFRIRMYQNYFLIFLLTFHMLRGKIDHLLACAGRKFSGKKFLTSSWELGIMSSSRMG